MENKKKKGRRGREEEMKKPSLRYGTLYRFVWNYEFLYGILKFCMDFHAIVPKPRVLLGFHPNLKMIESKVGKTLNSIRRI